MSEKVSVSEKRSTQKGPGSPFQTLAPDLLKRLFLLSELKRKILSVLYQTAKENSDRITIPISIPSLAQQVSYSVKSVENALVQLRKQDKLLTVYDSKKARGGWVMFQMEERFFNELGQATQQGVSSYYSDTDNSKGTTPQTNPEALSSEDSLKRRIEELKLQTESLKRLQQELFDAAFEQWLSCLTVEKIETLTPYSFDLTEKEAVLKQLFRDQHWLTLRKNPQIDVTQLQVVPSRRPPRAEK